MEKKKRVLIIALKFPPCGGSGVQRPLKFIKYLESFGWQAIVLTVDSDYRVKDNELLSDIPPSTEVVRVKYTSIDKKLDNVAKEISQFLANTPFVWRHTTRINSIIRRSLAPIAHFFSLPDTHVTWVRQAVKAGLALTEHREIHAIWSTSPPSTSHLVAYKIKKQTKIPWIADFRDEWTQNPFQNYFSKLHFMLDQLLERRVLKLADRVVSTTPKMTADLATLVKEPLEKFVTITNGYDLDDIYPYLRYHQSEQQLLTLTYVGALYADRSPLPLIKAIDTIIENKIIAADKIKLVFVGQRNKLISDMEKIWLVETGYVPHKEAIRFMSESSVLVLISAPYEKRSYAGKLFEYFAVSKPILALIPLDGATATLLSDMNLCFTAASNDACSIQCALEEIIEKWRRGELPSLVERETTKGFDRRILTEQLAKLLDQITSNRTDQ